MAKVASSDSGTQYSGKSTRARNQRRKRTRQRMRAAQQSIDINKDSQSSEPPPITDHASDQKASSNFTTTHLANTRKPMLVHPMPWKLIPITLPHFVPFNCSTQSGVEELRENFKSFMSMLEDEERCQKLTAIAPTQLQKPVENGVANPLATRRLVQGSEVNFSEVGTVETKSYSEPTKSLGKKQNLAVSESSNSRKHSIIKSHKLTATDNFVRKRSKKDFVIPVAAKLLVEDSEFSFSEVKNAAESLETKPNSEPRKSSGKKRKLDVSESSNARKHSIIDNPKKGHVHSKLKVQEKSHKLTSTDNVRKPSKKDFAIPVATKLLVENSEFHFSVVRTTSISLDAKPSSQSTKPPEKKRIVSTSESSSPRKVNVGQATAKQLEVLRNIRCGKKFYVKGNSVSVSPKVSPLKDFPTKQAHKGPLEMLSEKFVGKTFALGRKIATKNLVGASPNKKVPSKLLSTNPQPKSWEMSASKKIDKRMSSVTVDSEADPHKNLLSKHQPTKPLEQPPKMSFKQRLEKSSPLEGNLAKAPSVQATSEQVPTKPVGKSRKMSYDQRFGDEDSMIVDIDISPTKVFPSKKVSTKPLEKSRKVSQNQKISVGENAAQLDLTRPANVYPAKKPSIKSLGKSLKASIDNSIAQGKYSVTVDSEINPAKDFLPIRPTKPTETTRKTTVDERFITDRTAETTKQFKKKVTFADKSDKEKRSEKNSQKCAKKDVSAKSASTETSLRKKRQIMSVDECFREVENCPTGIERSPPKNVRVDRPTTPLEKSKEMTSGQRFDEEMQDFLSKRLPTRPAKMSRKISVSGRPDEGKNSVADNIEVQNPSEEVVAKQTSTKPLEKQQSPFNHWADIGDSASTNAANTEPVDMASSIKRCEDANYIRSILGHIHEVRSFRSLVESHDELDELDVELQEDFQKCYKRFVEKYNVIPHY